MAVRGDEVASSIEAHVREAIEKMVGEIRSSIEDVREVVDQQLKAALQSAQADVNSVTFLPHIKKSIGELEEGLKKAAPAGADASRVKRAIQSVEHGKSQVDILNALLEQAVIFGSRAALLILRGETFSGWKGVGFSAHGGNDETVKRFNAAPGLIPELDRVLRNEQVVIWGGANLSSRLGVTGSVKAILVPMVIKDKVAAAVYVDALPADVGKLDAASLELLVFTTGLLIDTLAIRKKIPSPSLTESGQQPVTPLRPATFPGTPLTPVPEHSEATRAIPASQIQEAMAAAAPPPRPAPAPTAPKPTPPPPAAPRPAPAPPPKPAAASGATSKVSAFATTAMPALEMPKPPATGLPKSGTGPMPALGPEEKTSTQYVPPANVARGGTSGASASDETKKHDEARRFARLLVSEIKLYNESKVEQGRKNKDLYERLKEDIDRSRQMYDERIAEDVRKASNYFYDELVRILADGDTSVLGL
jgi:hypothetical protein